MKQLLFVLIIPFLFFKTKGQNKVPDNNAIITGSFEIWAPGDSVSIYLWTEYLTYNETNYFTPVILSTALKNGKFTFQLGGIDRPIYFSLEKNAKSHYYEKPIEHYILEGGDKVDITEKAKEFFFSGKGYQKYECRRKLDSILNSKEIPDNQAIEPINRDDNNDLVSKYLTKCKATNSIFLKQENVLKEYKSSLSKEVYDLMYIDMIAKTQLPVINEIGFDLFMNEIKSKNEKEKIKQYFSRYIIDPSSTISEELLSQSTKYPAYYFKLVQTEYMLTDKARSYWNSIKEKFNGPFRDELLTIIFYESYKYLNNPDSMANDALSVIKNVSFQNFINETHIPLKKGVIMQDFSLPDIKGNVVKLSDYKGKVVFIDFWFTGCAPCAIYYNFAVSHAKQYFKDNPEVIFMAISGDKNREKWEKGIRSGEYTSDEAVNLYLEGFGFDEHPLTKYYKINGAPTPILIDKEGKIFDTNAFSLGSGASPDPQKLISKIEEALK